MIPWQGAGRKGRSHAYSGLIPSLSSPALARMIASYCPSSSFWSRVERFPLMLFTERSGRILRIWAFLLGLDVPTDAPSGRVSKTEFSRHTRTSAEESRGRTAAISSPGRQQDGMSLRLWTAPSPFPRRRASSIQPEKAPEPPNEHRGLSVSLSPLVAHGTISTGQPDSLSTAAILSACTRARALPLVSILMNGSPFRLPVLFCSAS